MGRWLDQREKQELARHRRHQPTAMKTVLALLACCVGQSQAWKPAGAFPSASVCATKVRMSHCVCWAGIVDPSNGRMVPCEHGTCTMKKPAPTALVHRDGEGTYALRPFLNHFSYHSFIPFVAVLARATNAAKHIDRNSIVISKMC